LTFLTGLYIGSVGVIDQLHAKPWYIAQIINSPAVILIGQHVKNTYLRKKVAIEAVRPEDRMAVQKQLSDQVYYVFARPAEIGQIYTSIAGLLNLLCIVNAVYISHMRQVDLGGEE
jgi:hypothetical protein